MMIKGMYLHGIGICKRIFIFIYTINHRVCMGKKWKRRRILGLKCDLLAFFITHISVYWGIIWTFFVRVEYKEHSHLESGKVFVFLKWAREMWFWFMMIFLSTLLMFNTESQQTGLIWQSNHLENHVLWIFLAVVV